MSPVTRPLLAVGTMLGLVVALTPPAHADEVRYGDDVRVPDRATIRIHGHGYGHGKGLSQHGAQGMALEGYSGRQIAAHYYPGTQLGRTHGEIRVKLSNQYRRSVVVRPRRGLGVRDLGRGKSAILPRGRADLWRIVVTGARRDAIHYKANGRWHRWGYIHGQGEFFAGNRPITLLTTAGDKRYRGRLRAALPAGVAPGGGSSRVTVNALGMSAYLRGVVGLEMPTSWDLDAVKAQTIAARTYAAYERDHSNGRYHLCDTTACQVYGGHGAEDDRVDEAIRQTRNVVVNHNGAPAFTQFSASSGGITADGPTPYLTPQWDPYDDWGGNSVHDWKTEVGARKIEQAWPALGNLTRIVVLDRADYGHWGGRVKRVRFHGSRNTVTTSGTDVRWKLGLRSTWFKFKWAR